MYHKISSLMLNLAKSSSGHREVYVAQPDNLTQQVAGKVFILFELEAKKADAKKIYDFLINGIDQYYYQDEKIFLRDKIEGLKLENIFEAFLTKLNRALSEFLISENIRVKSSDFNITIGLIYENQLFFSNFGRNRAYLIYKKADQYEIINVESSASDVERSDYQDQEDEQVVSERMKNFKIFSSVVSGEIPSASYFFFTNENLPEYLSTKEMVLIISKLPPMVATEQMKQSLAKVNSYAPFLGIIIKNTLGLSEQDEKEEILENLSAQSSISTLKHTERKTEDMLSPTGFFDKSKFKNNFDDFLSKISNFFKKLFPFLKIKDKKVKQAVEKTKEQKKEVVDNSSDPKSSIDIKTKIEVVKSSSLFFKFVKTIKNFIVNLFTANFWSNSFTDIFKNFKTLHPKRKLLIISVALLLIVLIISISITNRQKRLQEHNEQFMATIEEIQDRYDLIESYLLYDNEDGAKLIIGEISDEISELKALNEEQEELLTTWQNNLQESRREIQKLTIINEPEKLFDTVDLNSSAEPRNLAIINNNLYVSDPAGKIIYIYNPENNEPSSNLINASGELNLQKPFVYDDKINYLENESLAQIDPEVGQYEEISVSGLVDKKTNALDIYEVNDLLYSLHSAENSILRHSPANSFTQFNNWLQEDVDLSSAIDMAVTGEIWILKSNADILRLFLGANDTNFNLDNVDPPLNSASKLIVNDNDLYIFDSSSKRLVKYNYDGSFESQYQFPDLEDVFDLSIDHQLERVYLLSDTKIYSFSF